MTKNFRVYGGYAKFPEHPSADLSGVVRFCVLAVSPSDAIMLLQRYGVRLRQSEYGHTWEESNSLAEAEATANRYGDVFFAATSQAYLKSSVYICDKNLTYKKRQMRQKVAEAQGSAVAATTVKRTKKDAGFP
jgi:hypothetical protein